MLIIQLLPVCLTNARGTTNSDVTPKIRSFAQSNAAMEISTVRMNRTSETVVS